MALKSLELASLSKQNSKNRFFHRVCAFFHTVRARNFLAPTRLVHFCVNNIMKSRGRKQQLNSLSREDLIQEGAIGLARAVDKYDLAIGGKFSTYAMYWVRAAVLRCIAERDDMLRVPSHVSQAPMDVNVTFSLMGSVAASVRMARTYMFLSLKDPFHEPPFRAVLQPHFPRNAFPLTSNRKKPHFFNLPL